MSDKSSIFVRYQIEDNRDNEVYKGIIGNHYSGFFPFGMMSQAACGLKYFLQNAADVRYIRTSPKNFWNSTYQCFRRMFDVDEIHYGMNVSFDSATDVAAGFYSGKIPKEKLNEEFFWCDTDFGQLLIDIRGHINGRSAECTVKYAYITNICKPESITDVDGYFDEYKDRFDPEEIDILKDIRDYLKNTAVLMTQKEVNEFIATPVYEFLFSEESWSDVDRWKETAELEESRSEAFMEALEKELDEFETQ